MAWAKRGCLTLLATLLVLALLAAAAGAWWWQGYRAFAEQPLHDGREGGYGARNKREDEAKGRDMSDILGRVRELGPSERADSRHDY